MTDPIDALAARLAEIMCEEDRPLRSTVSIDAPDAAIASLADEWNEYASLTAEAAERLRPVLEAELPKLPGHYVTDTELKQLLAVANAEGRRIEAERDRLRVGLRLSAQCLADIVECADAIGLRDSGLAQLAEQVVIASALVGQFNEDASEGAT